MKPNELSNDADILYLKGVINYTELHYQSGKKHVTCLTLKRYEESLSHFIRVSRSHLINPRHVVKILSREDGKVVELSSGLRVPVSRRRSMSIKHIQK